MMRQEKGADRSLGGAKRTVVTLMLASGVLVCGAAQAQNVALGALLGGGAGALIGNSVAGRAGAIVGGTLGAMAGVAATAVQPVSYGYGYGPAVVSAPPVRVYPPAVYAPPVYAPPVVSAPMVVPSYPAVVAPIAQPYYAPPLAWASGWGHGGWHGGWHGHHRHW